MQRDERDLLDVLKFELDFLEKGGYGRSPREPWKPRFVFEDSPTCMNYDCKDNPAPCTDCVLMQLVPPEHRAEKIPCRFIPFNPSGETLDSLYRWGDQHEIEDAVRNWLRGTIHRLEEERSAPSRNGNNQTALPSTPVKGTPLYESVHPKCANPACPTGFHWLGGGKFFRFRPDEPPANPDGPLAQSPAAIHGVKHYWLCELCAQVYTLIFEKEHGVVLKELWPELPVHKANKELSTN